MIRFLPTYVGSKQYWVSRLQKYKNSNIVELFAGSAVLSANLAKTAVLNDLDPEIYKILSQYDQQEVPELFTRQDYFKYRASSDWYKYAFCLQKMSFSGVFRYGKKGYNVPIKKNATDIRVRSDYLEALERWKQLKPIVLNLSYDDISTEHLLGPNNVIVSDPPYQAKVPSASAAYCKDSFDYEKYWFFVLACCVAIKQKRLKALVVFDRASNLEKQNIPIIETRKMRVNGKHRGDEEAIAIYENDKWQSSLNATINEVTECLPKPTTLSSS